MNVEWIVGQNGHVHNEMVVLHPATQFSVCLGNRLYKVQIFHEQACLLRGLRTKTEGPASEEQQIFTDGIKDHTISSA